VVNNLCPPCTLNKIRIAVSLPAYIAVYRTVNCMGTLNQAVTHSIVADIHGGLGRSPCQVNGGG
jgi:hypothetical protein